ncbi:hypothetical protein LEMLEM_LOCUS15044 [Lemmus lemmus]
MKKPLWDGFEPLRNQLQRPNSRIAEMWTFEWTQETMATIL